MIMSSQKCAVYATSRACWLALTIILASFQLALASPLQSSTRTISGAVVDDKGQVLPGMVVNASGVNGEWRTTTNSTGQFTLDTPNQDVSLRIEGPYIKPLVQSLTIASASENLRIQVEYRIPPIHQSLVIAASALEPQVETHSDEVYKRSLFSRDDQLLETLNAGINAGQHEGGGKSLEIRRFGFNLDHGGVNGGLKVLVDDVQQNQGTQGHGQGYLGALKAVTPELIQDVTIINGPFSAEYGDFSGLGVVHIRQRESLPDQFMARLEGGNFNTGRGFLAYSPDIQRVDSYIAYEGSYTDGPFINPGRYRRDNVNANYTRSLDGTQKLGFRFIFGRNDFYSSGQLPLDLVTAVALDRFGYVDPTDGGRVKLGTLSTYYSRSFTNGDMLKADAFFGRSLFDLYSNFTFFLNDPVNGDAFQQHDSRLQEGANLQYTHPHRIGHAAATFHSGLNFHDNQINVGLYPRDGRVPTGVTTRANAHVTNEAGYAQEMLSFWNGRLLLGGGIRFDEFRYNLQDRVDPAASGLQYA